MDMSHEYAVDDDLNNGMPINLFKEAQKPGQVKCELYILHFAPTGSLPIPLGKMVREDASAAIIWLTLGGC